MRSTSAEEEQALFRFLIPGFPNPPETNLAQESGQEHASPHYYAMPASSSPAAKRQILILSETFAS